MLCRSDRDLGSEREDTRERVNGRGDGSRKFLVGRSRERLVSESISSCVTTLDFHKKKRIYFLNLYSMLNSIMVESVRFWDNGSETGSIVY